MRFVLASTFVPFINGGARFIVEWLEEKLLEHGHQVERFYFPFIDTPDELLTQIAALRLVDLSDAGDRLIAFRPPSYVLQHPHKILWFIHHIRAYYDMWDSPFGLPHTPRNESVRSALRQVDNVSLGEARRVFTNSQIVADRLKTYNGVQATPLYPPIFEPERFHSQAYGDEILVVCRVEPHKRQDLLIEALRHTRTPVKLRLCGRTSAAQYGEALRAAVARYGLSEKVVFDDRWISEAEKADLLSTALAVAYLPLDEDSYGYPSLEAAHASKGVVTTTDSGGVLELVQDGVNGFVCPPNPAAIAARFDELYRDRDRAQRLGAANNARIRELRIDWDHVISAMTQ
jgi:glycosyltransferase involved in cell wall biosynthesis